MRRLVPGLFAALVLNTAQAELPGARQALEVLGADIEQSYDLAVAKPTDGRFAVAVDLADDNLVLRHDTAAGRLHILYRMNFNQVAEGWSWQPQANPAEADYYRFKFLPLGTREREQGTPYVHEDFPGRPRQVRRVWRYDYFFAFDNPYEFFARPTVEDDAGFAAAIDATPARAAELSKPGRIGMVAWARWVNPRHADSTTFWKATDGKPVDLTLKNRYLIGKLEEVWFVDASDGRPLARLLPKP